MEILVFFDEISFELERADNPSRAKELDANAVKVKDLEREVANLKMVIVAMKRRHIRQ